MDGDDIKDDDVLVRSKGVDWIFGNEFLLLIFSLSVRSMMMMLFVFLKKDKKSVKIFSAVVSSEEMIETSF